MIHKIVALRDATADCYLTPQFERNLETAKRNLSNAMEHPDSILRNNSADFDLWHIGDYDDDEGILIPTTPHVKICSCASLKKGD